MTVREFYDKINGSYDEFLGRVGTEERAKKYIRMFTMDPTFSELNSSIEANDIPTAFRAVHTLKGLSANLALTDLYNASVVLTEILRNYNGEDYTDALAGVREKYNNIVEAIALLD
jgi:HPt (histidine-containing phosphotransfer) domain-containing protein